jgi:endonuclease III
MEKLPFDIDWMVEQIRQAVQDLPKAALFELHELGYTSLFEQLVACIISIRTLDEVTLPVAQALFAEARTPAGMLALTPDQIDQLIRSSTFHERKAAQIHAIAARAEAEFGGQLPCQLDLLLSFSGVGPKCAHLALGIACGMRRVSADVHVHRVTNRWGYISTRTPEQSGLALEARLPERYWIEINRLLVPFGKHICTGPRPRCSSCPVLAMCRQVGVARAAHP